MMPNSWERVPRTLNENGHCEWMQMNGNAESVRHPNEWARDDVLSWIHTCKEQYALDDFDTSKFAMNGKGLCMLNRSDFIARHPNAGDLLYNTLQALIATSNNINNGIRNPPRDFQHIERWRGGSVQMQPYPAQLWHNKVQIPFQDPHMNHNGIYDHMVTNPSAVDLSSHITEAAPDVCDAAFDEDYKDCRLLWDFIARILTKSTTRNISCVKWESEEELTFKIIDPTKLAQLWGRNKKKSNMTYEKLSRALRYYYKLKILRKVPGRKLTYQFLISPENLVKNGKGRLQSRASEVSTSGQNDDASDYKSIQDIEENISDLKSDAPSSPDSDLVIKSEMDMSEKLSDYDNDINSPLSVVDIPDNDSMSVVKCVYNGQIYNGETKYLAKDFSLSQMDNSDEISHSGVYEEPIHFKKRRLLNEERGKNAYGERDISR